MEPLDVFDNAAKLTKAKFDAYFAGLENGVAIEIGRVQAFCSPGSLDELRRACLLLSRRCLLQVADGDQLDRATEIKDEKRISKILQTFDDMWKSLK